MTSTFAVEARTALSPEWDHGFDEAFTDLISSDADWVRDEFDALIGANWNEPPEPPAPPAPATGRSEPPPPSSDDGQHTPSPATRQVTANPNAIERSPP